MRCAITYGTMTAPNPSPFDLYLASLTQKDADLDQRQAELDAAYQRDSEALAAERAEIQAAMRHGQAFVQSQGNGSAPVIKAAAPPTIERTVAPELSKDERYWAKRLGAKHAEVLQALKLRGSTTRDISAQTGVAVDVVRNFMHADVRRGMVKRRGSKIHITPVGERVLSAATAEAQKESAPSPKTGGGFMQ